MTKNEQIKEILQVLSNEARSDEYAVMRLSENVSNDEFIVNKALKDIIALIQPKTTSTDIDKIKRFIGFVFCTCQPDLGNHFGLIDDWCREFERTDGDFTKVSDSFRKQMQGLVITSVPHLSNKSELKKVLVAYFSWASGVDRTTIEKCSNEQEFRIDDFIAQYLSSNEKEVSKEEK